MRHRLRALAASFSALGLALATLGGAMSGCVDGHADAGMTAEAPAAHDCEGGTAPVERRHHDDCTMLAASCAPVLLAVIASDATPTVGATSTVPLARDDARPDGAVRGPAPPPPRA